MNRKTDISRLRDETSGEAGARPVRGDAAVEQATTLLVNSMQQSDGPISDLGDALARMARALSDGGAPLFADAAGESTGSLQALRDSLIRDIAVCIQSLQFHDRLMQQLTQARDLLTGNAAGLLAHVPSVSANEGSIEGTVELF
jgi:hypothetical protein